jgi:hypothetical protein
VIPYLTYCEYYYNKDGIYLFKKKNRQYKKDWAMAQVVKSLPRKHKAQSSTPSTFKKKKEK